VGQGVQRLVAIFSEVIGDKPGVALVDEIENGVHHAVHETVWAGLAAMAEKLEVQVFATTHSEECLEAAHRAFAKRPNYDFSVIRLFRVESGPQGRVLDRKHIEAALAGDIDLR
jgi:AAA15 family ATPase/GTPase